MKSTKECAVCGQTFERVHARYENPKHCSRACANKAPGRMTPEIRAKIAIPGERKPNWKGGQWVGAYGYVFIRIPVEQRHLFPRIRPDGYARRSHYVWNMAHPEDLVRPGDVIHHIDGVKTNDVIENLEKTNQSDHAREHGTGRWHTAESRAKMSRVQRERRARERAARS